MSVELLTPAGLTVALAAVAPLALLALAERRGDRARAAIGLAPRTARGLAAPAAALVAVGVLAAIAAAQPVVRSRAEGPVRTDAAAYVVLDTTRSMLAARSPGSPTRFERARRAAFAVRDRLEGVPVGVASISDRVLPHLFPSPDRTAFAGTVTRALAAGRPEPAAAGPSGSNLTALAAIPTQNFFAPSVRRRIAVVITDAESDPLQTAVLERAFRAEPRTALVVLRIGDAGETILDARGRPEPGYAASPSAPTLAHQAAASAAGQVAVDARSAGELAARVLGASGPTEARPGQERRTPLAPYAILAAAVPLAVLVRRRNIR